MPASGGRTRRSILTGRACPPPQTIHISSAVISVLPAHRGNVGRLLAALPGVEIHHQTSSKIVIVLEGTDSGALGSRLLEIASMQGVLSANMVFEQSAQLADFGE